MSAGSMGPHPSWAVVAGALLLVASPAATAAQQLRWIGSVAYSRGAYVFDQTTSTWSISNGLSVGIGRFELSATLPVLLQNSGWVSQVGGVSLPTGGEESAAVRERRAGQTIGSEPRRSGGGTATTPREVTYRNAYELQVGDPFMSASISMLEGLTGIRSIRANLYGKAPIRSVESGVSTGAWDFGAGGSAIAAFAGTFFFADVSYWWFGDLPDLELRNGLTYGGGLSRPVWDARGSVSLSYVGATAVIDTMDPPGSVSLGLGYALSAGTTLSGGLTVGVTESAPDVAAYLGWSIAVH